MSNNSIDPKAIWEPGNIPITDQTTFTYQQLCAQLLTLGGPYDDDAFVNEEALKLLEKAGLFWRQGGKGDLTDLGEEVCQRLEEGGHAPELLPVANG